MNRNESLVTLKEQEEVCSKNSNLLDKLKNTKNVQEWNYQRDVVLSEFKGTPKEALLFFGYADAVLFPEIHGRKVV